MKFTLIVLFLFVSIISAQVDIVSTLKHIESGEIDEAKSDFRRLNSRYPDDANVKFLAAVLAENGDEALQKYSMVYTKHPNSQFADAALYRVFSYYYSLGIYNKAERYLTQLKDNYPNSPYIKAADRNLPSEDFFIQSVTDTKEEETPTVSKVIEKYKYTVQAGAFLNKTNANNLKKKFEAKGMYADIYTKEVGGSLLNVIVIGKFKDKDSAQPLLDELKKDYKLNGRVVLLN
ncbi:MAG: SPOR domain-containing protein [Melioribacteraceae bacterium]|jgi:tetratricopeptide (TPR) repeat protein|nr:SPOR domain-containing protein [Melioribacteraceae bacterium]